MTDDKMTKLQRQSAGSHYSGYVTLAVLRLGPQDYDSLARQGFVSAERRGNGQVYYKLRFRRGRNQQIVRYIGKDAKFAEKIRCELAKLQAPHRATCTMYPVPCTLCHALGTLYPVPCAVYPAPCTRYPVLRPIHALTHSLTYSLAHSPTRLLTCYQREAL